MSVIRIFLDTEFTSFDKPKLISLGLVAETGQTFYAELSDGWTELDCGEFVVTDVLPHLTRHPDLQVNRAGLKSRVQQWLEQLAPPPVCAKVIFDADTDWRLLHEACGNLNTANLDVQPEWLDMPHPMRVRCDDLLEQYFETHGPRHHALVDARGLCQAVLQTEREFREG